MKTYIRLLLSIFSFKKLIVTALLTMFSVISLNAQTIDIPTGSVVIDMGVVPQTIENALKPYGLAYSLIKDLAHL